MVGTLLAASNSEYAQGRKNESISKPATWEIITSSLAINILSLALPVMTLQIYDRILGQQGVGTLLMLVAGVGTIIVMECLLNLMRAYITCMQGARFEHEAGIEAMGRILDADMRIVDASDVGEHTQNLSAIGKLKDFYSGQMLSTLMDVPFLMVFLGLIGYLAGWLVLVPLCLLAVFTVLAWFVGETLKDSLANRDVHDSRRFGFMIEALKGIHTIKALGLEAPFVRQYEGLQSQASIENFRVAENNGMASNMGSIFSQVMVVAVTAAGAPLVLGQSITTGTLIACVLLAGRVMQPVLRGLSLWARVQDYRLAEVRLERIFGLEPISSAYEGHLIANEGRLECRDVTFAYSEGDTPALEGITLSLEPGEAIALHGEHSSGKTTLMEIIAGVYPPDLGSVQVNGVEVTAIPQSERTKHIGYMPTSSVIFRGTIMENLCGFDTTRQPKALEISALLGIHDLVSRMPMGYDTMLEGEQADVIPPGLKQRITIGRVLVERPRLLLFDHADRALDKAAYNQVFQLLGKLKGRATMVLVSDDKNLLSLADRHYTLKNGRLMEESEGIAYEPLRVVRV